MNDSLFETTYWRLFWKDDQTYLGSLIIKTKAERQSLPELTREEQEDFFSLIKNLETFFKQQIGATMFNYSCLMNNAYRDKEVPHVHFHFRPRYQNPVNVLGIVCTDPNFGEHYISGSLIKKEVVALPQEVKQYLTQKLVDYLTNV